MGGWLDVHVAHHDPQAPAHRLFRRRIPLELTVDELALLEGAQAEHGSKRSTLVAGLRALAAESQAQQALDAARKERDAALAKADSEATRAQNAEATVAGQAAKTDRATKTSRSDAARLERDLAKAKADTAAVTKQLRACERQRSDLEAECGELDQVAVDMLRCARCDAWAAPDEWAYQPSGDGGQFIYHKPCGFHDKGLVSISTVMAYRRD